MPAAPEGYVKVYLYGYMYARHGIAGENVLLQDVAKALSMEESAVQQAFRYWERCRLVQRTQDHPPEYRYLNVQQTLVSRQSVPQDEGYMAFAQALYAIFGDKRKLHGNETVLAYEWVEQLGLPSEVVLMMIQHLVSTRGVQFSFKEAQKLALELCEQRIGSLEAAEQLFSRSESARKGTRKILRHMGKYRDPSLDETDLYVKWTTEWGFAPQAIESACGEMTGGDPSFKYLDKILQGLRERSGRESTSAAQMEKQLAQEKEETQLVREMLTACGLKATVVDEGKRLVYRDMTQYGGHGVIMLAAEAVGKRRGGHSLDAVTELLVSWHGKGLHTAEAAKAYLETVREQNQILKALYQSAGREATPTLADRELLCKWRQEWNLSEALLKQAAEYAKNSGKPMPFMDKILQSWHEKGITRLEDAQADHEGRKAALTADKPVKTVIEQQYVQRTYDSSQFPDFTPEEIEEMLKL
jgi:DnaD/phage-associated family protein